MRDPLSLRLSTTWKLLMQRSTEFVSQKVTTDIITSITKQDAVLNIIYVGGCLHSQHPNCQGDRFEALFIVSNSVHHTNRLDSEMISIELVVGISKLKVQCSNIKIQSIKNVGQKSPLVMKHETCITIFMINIIINFFFQFTPSQKQLDAMNSS